MFFFIFSLLAAQKPKPILKNVNQTRIHIQKRSNIDELMAKTRDVSVHLERLKLPALRPAQTVRVSNPKVASEESSSDSDIVTLRFCKGCASSFDSIFEDQRKLFIKPYKNSLELELGRNKLLSIKLANSEKKWHDEANKWYHLSNYLDHLQDKYDYIFQKNQTLRMTASNYHMKTVASEHNYAGN